MNAILLQHQWKYFLRSKGKNTTIVTQIIMGIVLLYLLSAACFIGIILKQILESQYGKLNAINVFCQILLVYYAIDIVLRFLWQELPTIILQPYLLQNIRRKQLIAFLNIRSLFTFLNLLPILLFIPFIVVSIGNQQGILVASAFIISILTICCGNHFLILFIKRKTINSGWWLFGFILFLLLIGILNHFDVISIKNASSFLFNNLLSKPWICTILLVYAYLTFRLNSALLQKDFYFDMASKTNNHVELQNSLLKMFTSEGSLLDIELKSIFRNKRPRIVFLMSFIMLGWGFLMFKKEIILGDNLALAIVISVIVIGALVINYGQFLFAWQSAFFDGLMTHNLKVKAYIKSKFIILTILATINVILSSFYGFIDWHFNIILFAIYLFIIGVLPVIAVLVSLYNYKGIDVSQRASFNYQGLSLVNFLYSLGLFVIVFGIYYPFAYFHKPWWGIITFGIVGIINLLLRNWWIDLLTIQFYKKKYKILNGFREK